MGINWYNITTTFPSSGEFFRIFWTIKSYLKHTKYSLVWVVSRHILWKKNSGFHEGETPGWIGDLPTVNHGFSNPQSLVY